MMKVLVIMDISILRFYGYIENIGEILIEQKLFKNHKNA